MQAKPEQEIAGKSRQESTVIKLVIRRPTSVIDGVSGELSTGLIAPLIHTLGS